MQAHHTLMYVCDTQWLTILLLYVVQQHTARLDCCLQINTCQISLYLHAPKNILYRNIIQRQVRQILQPYDNG